MEITEFRSLYHGCALKHQFMDMLVKCEHSLIKDQLAKIVEADNAGAAYTVDDLKLRFDEFFKDPLIIEVI